MQHIDVTDIDTHSFTARYLQNGIGFLQNSQLKRFIKSLVSADKVALKTTSDSIRFTEWILLNLARVIIAPWQYETSRKSVKKADKNDTGLIAFFLSKYVMPEARMKSKMHNVELVLLISGCYQAVKLRMSILRVYGPFIKNEPKVKKASATTKVSFIRITGLYKWSMVKKIEIVGQLNNIKNTGKNLRSKIMVSTRLKKFINFTLVFYLTNYGLTQSTLADNLSITTQKSWPDITQKHVLPRKSKSVPNVTTKNKKWNTISSRDAVTGLNNAMLTNRDLTHTEEIEAIRKIFQNANIVESDHNIKQGLRMEVVDVILNPTKPILPVKSRSLTNTTNDNHNSRATRYPTILERFEELNQKEMKTNNDSDGRMSPVNNIGYSISKLARQIRNAQDNLIRKLDKHSERNARLRREVERELNWQSLGSWIDQMIKRKRLPDNIRCVLNHVQNDELDNIIYALERLDSLESLSSYDTIPDNQSIGPDNQNYYWELREVNGLADDNKNHAGSQQGLYPLESWRSISGSIDNDSSYDIIPDNQSIISDNQNYYRELREVSELTDDDRSSAGSQQGLYPLESSLLIQPQQIFNDGQSQEGRGQTSLAESDFSQVFDSGVFDARDKKDMDTTPLNASAERTEDIKVSLAVTTVAEKQEQNLLSGAVSDNYLDETDNQPTNLNQVGNGLGTGDNHLEPIISTDSPQERKSQGITHNITHDEHLQVVVVPGEHFGVDPFNKKDENRNGDGSNDVLLTQRAVAVNPVIGNYEADSLERMKAGNKKDLFKEIQTLYKTSYDSNKLLSAIKETVLDHLKETGGTARELEHATMLFGAQSDSESAKLVMDARNFLTLSQAVGAIRKNITVNNSWQETIAHTINQVGNILSNRLSIMTATATPLGIASGDEEFTAKYGVWAMPLYSQGKQKPRGSHFGYKVKSGGGIIGLDTNLNDNKTMIGVALAVISSNVKYDTGYADKTNANNLIFSFYGKQYLTGGLFAQGVASYSSTKVRHTEERIFSSGSQVAKAHCTPRSYSGKVLLGYDARFTNNILVTPFTGVSHIKFKGGTYRETGLAFANRTVVTSSSDRTDAVVGAKASISININNGMVIIPEIYGMLSMRIQGKAGKIATKINGMDEPFTNIPKAVSTISNSGFGITAKSRALGYGVFYDLQSAKKYISHQGALKITVNL